jgi:hypothetical protein
MLTRAKRARPWRGNISTPALVACAIAAWSAGPAHANGPMVGVPAPVTAVPQAATSAVASRSATSPGRPAARVATTRAAVAEPTRRTASPAAPAAGPGTERLATVVETAANHAATAVEAGAPTVRGASDDAESAVRAGSAGVARPAARASKNRVADLAGPAASNRAADGAGPAARVASNHAGATVFERILAAVQAAPQRLAVTIRTVSAQAAADVRSAQMRAADFGADTFSELGRAAIPSAVRAGGMSRRPVPAGVATSSSGMLHAAVVGRGWRHATSDRSVEVSARHASRPPGGELPAVTVATTLPGSPMSAADGPASTAATAHLGLLALLLLAGQRLGSVVRLRAASAPTSLFLALSERPG